MYKILAENGVHFVCTSDNIKLPRQTRTTVEQNLKNSAIVLVDAFCLHFKDKQDLYYTIDGDRVFLNDNELLDVELVGICVTYDSMYKRTDFKLRLSAKLVDTIETPISLHERTA